MSAFNFYALEQAKGFPGMKADVTVDVVDSFASEGGIDPGEAVIRGTDPQKQVKAVASADDVAKVIGIAVHTHKGPVEGGKYYEEGYCLSVMTFGDIYVQAGGDVTAGDAVAIEIGADGPIFVASGGTGTDVAGMTYLESGVEGDIVAVRIRK